MPANIFSINGDEINSYDSFKESIRNRNISNSLYMPDNFSSAKGYDRFTDITFMAISFKSTRFECIKFVNCSFSKCLFLSAKFVKCDFSNCKFSDCNFMGSSWEKTRIDPNTLKNNFDFKNDANIACNLFQTLYELYKNEHQPQYARQSRYFLNKARYGLNFFYYKRGDIGKTKLLLKKCQSHCHRLLSGYGVYKWRIALTFFVFLIVSSGLNHLLQDFIFSSEEPPISPDHSFIQSAYYTFISVTTIGFGDMVPKTEIGRILTMGEASVGIILIATILNFFAEKE